MSTTVLKMYDTRTGQTVKLFITGLMALAFAMISLKPVAARGAPDTFADLVEKLQPAVVNISTVQTIERPRGRSRPQLPEGLPFGDFWDQFRDRFEEDEEPRQARSLGSGFIIDPSGIVITNNHVIEEADEITVLLEDGEEYMAEVLGRDALSDVAVLQIEADDDVEFPFVKWGDSDKDRIGDWVVAIGNPFGLGGTVSAGILSARNRTINSQDVEFIQTDAPINRGNSGGPLFNMKGEVIGVNTAIFSPTGGNVGIGFAIPANDAARVARELQDHGKVRRGWLGVGIQPMTKELAEALGSEIKKGAMVTRVEPDSPAAAAGIEEGDIIFRWDGKPIEDSNDLSRLVKRTDIDDTVNVQVVREGKTVTLKVTTGELKVDGDETGRSEDRDSDAEEDSHALVEGMELVPLTDNLRRRYNIGDEVEGVAVTRVARRSPAYRAGVRPGAVITRVNQIRVDSPAAIADMVEDARDEGRERILVLVTLRGNSVHIPLKLLKEKEEDGE